MSFNIFKGVWGGDDGFFGDRKYKDFFWCRTDRGGGEVGRRRRRRKRLEIENFYLKILTGSDFLKVFFVCLFFPSVEPYAFCIHGQILLSPVSFVLHLPPNSENEHSLPLSISFAKMLSVGGYAGHSHSHTLTHSNIHIETNCLNCIYNYKTTATQKDSCLIWDSTKKDV